jgi:hypothetical protein
MPTECNPAVFEFPRLEGRAVVASFDGGRITSDAGALLLGATDRVIGLTRRLATCFKDSRNPAFVEHSVETLLMQRIVGIAPGYEDLVVPVSGDARVRPHRLGHDGARRGLPPSGDSLAARGAEGSRANGDGYRSSRRVEQSFDTSGRHRPPGCLESTRGSHLGQRSRGRTTGRTHERSRPSAYFVRCPLEPQGPSTHGIIQLACAYLNNSRCSRPVVAAGSSATFRFTQANSINGRISTPAKPAPLVCRFELERHGGHSKPRRNGTLLRPPVLPVRCPKPSPRRFPDIRSRRPPTLVAGSGSSVRSRIAPREAVSFRSGSGPARRRQW